MLGPIASRIGSLGDLTHDDLSPVHRTALIADIGLGVVGLLFGVIYRIVGGSGETEEGGDDVVVHVQLEGVNLELLVTRVTEGGA